MHLDGGKSKQNMEALMFKFNQQQIILIKRKLHHFIYYSYKLCNDIITVLYIIQNTLQRESVFASPSAAPVGAKTHEANSSCMMLS